MTIAKRMTWQYTTVTVDTWLPLGVQGGVVDLLEQLGQDGWEAFGVTPPTPPVGEGEDPDASTYDVLLKRRSPLDGRA